MFSRNHRSRVTVARGSALEMEFKRGRFRLSLFSDPPENKGPFTPVSRCPRLSLTQKLVDLGERAVVEFLPLQATPPEEPAWGQCGGDTELQRKLDHEIRMREGACKLLAACSQREQALEATKSLLVCNSRILSYMGELQRRKEAQVLGKTGRRPSDSGPPAERSPCRGRVCISDLRIPLMWKDTEYFKNKGDLHRWAVFLLLQLGEHIQDTEMILVDRTLTDISFQSNVLFTEAGPDFELRLELYGACVEEEGVLAGAPKRLATKLSSSLGRSSGRRVRASLDSAGSSGSSPILLPTPAVGGPRYHLLAHTTLTLAAVQDGFRTHDLTLASHEENPAWLPLYGSVCCRLAAQPLCMTQPTASGTLRVQETRVRAGELDQAPGRPFTLSISNQYGEDEVTHTLQTESREALQSWREALWQLFFDMSQWKQCCDEIMKIETPAPRKPPQALAKQGSLYHEMVLAEPVVSGGPGEGLLLQDNAVSAEIRALLSSYYSDSDPHGPEASAAKALRVLGSSRQCERKVLAAGSGQERVTMCG
ncbi:Rhotekin [Tupaia chinensis]|uniref:Rhotekin n=1 Tax=Tupaia chinensis TaxID=246437 RepID=L9KMM7_TUPCH|nr:Rhotekin [Tupaia chinensis]